MSEENVAAFRRAVDAGNRGDLSALMADCTRRLSGILELPNRGRVRRPLTWAGAGVRDAVRDFSASFPSFSLEMPEVRDLGDRVLALGRIHAHGAESGIDIDSPLAYLVRFEDGKAIWVHSYLDARMAFEAVGLSE